MAKRRVTPGTGQLNLEIEQSLLEHLRTFVRDRGEKIRHVVELAIRRHLDNPPPPPRPAEIVPLPPYPPPRPPASTGPKPAPRKKPRKPSA
jgi:hypothetical protein